MQAAALVRLWGTGYVERIQPPPAPFHILAQQIMALALQHGGIGRADWRSQVGGVQAFQRMADEHVSGVLDHMIASGILFDDQGLLWLGREGEEEYGRRHFMDLFTAFVSEPLVAVRHGETHIGNVHPTTFARWPGGEVVLVLGGRSWRVTHVDWRERLAYVVPSEDHGRSRWTGSGQPIRYELCQAMRDVLLGCELPATVSRRATEKLEELRQDFTWLEAGSTAVVRAPDGSRRWWTFGGLHANAALAAWLKGRGGYGVAPNNLSIKLSGDQSTTKVEVALRELRSTSAETLVPEVSDRALEGLKFTACLPEGLARRVLQRRMMDVAGVEKILAEPARLVRIEQGG